MVELLKFFLKKSLEKFLKGSQERLLEIFSYFIVTAVFLEEFLKKFIEQTGIPGRSVEKLIPGENVEMIRINIRQVYSRRQHWFNRIHVWREQIFLKECLDDFLNPWEIFKKKIFQNFRINH